MEPGEIVAACIGAAGVLLAGWSLIWQVRGAGPKVTVVTQTSVVVRDIEDQREVLLVRVRNNGGKPVSVEHLIVQRVDGDGGFSYHDVADRFPRGREVDPRLRFGAMMGLAPPDFPCRLEIGDTQVWGYEFRLNNEEAGVARSDRFDVYTDLVVCAVLGNGKIVTSAPVAVRLHSFGPEEG